MALNMVPLAPGVVVMPAGNPITRGVLEAVGVEVIEAEVGELMRGGVSALHDGGGEAGVNACRWT